MLQFPVSRSAQLGEYRAPAAAPSAGLLADTAWPHQTPALPGLNHKSFLKTTTRVNANISTSQQQPGSGSGIQTQEKWFLVCTRTMALLVLAYQQMKRSDRSFMNLLWTAVEIRIVRDIPWKTEDLLWVKYIIGQI